MPPPLQSFQCSPFSQSTHFRWVWSMPLFGIASNFAFFCPQIFPQLSYPDTSLAAAPVATEKPQINPQGKKNRKKHTNKPFQQQQSLLDKIMSCFCPLKGTKSYLSFCKHYFTVFLGFHISDIQSSPQGNTICYNNKSQAFTS